jgi:hypothetical protein
MNVTINWATVIAVVTALAGAAGSIITPIWGTQLATQVQVVLQALAGLLVLIPAAHATSVTAHVAKAKASARLGRPV